MMLLQRAAAYLLEGEVCEVRELGQVQQVLRAGWRPTQLQVQLLEGAAGAQPCSRQAGPPLDDWPQGCHHVVGAWGRLVTL